MIPNTGAHVDSIHVDGIKVDSLASYTFVDVQASHTIAAFFSINEYTITSSETGPGTISPTPSVSVSYGSNQTFTLTPNTGAHVDSIHVDGVRVDSLASYTFVNVQANHTIAAFFSLNQFTITSSESGPGTISPTPSVNVSYGSNQTFTLTPNTGAHVDSIHVDGIKVDSLASYTFVNVQANHTIAAFFSLNQFTITSSESGPGTISPTPSVNVSYGSNQTFTLTPNTGAHVDSIHVDGIKVDSLASYTFVNVQANHTIAAFFSINEYTITSSETGPGTISPTPSVNVIYGNNEKFTMTPNTGAHVDSIHVDGVRVDSLASYTFVNVQANHTIAAFFSLNQFTITSSETGPGTISPTPSVNVSYGSNQTFTLTPNTGAHVDSIHVDGVKVDSLASYTFVNVQANHTIAAFFSLNQFTITSSATGPGTIAPTPSVNVIYGNNEKFTMTPNTGAHVDSIHVDGVKVDSLASYTFVNVQTNHTIAAFFSLNEYTITSSATGPGTIAPTPSVNVIYGNNEKFTMTPNTGAHVDSIHVDGVKVDSLASYTFINVQANHTIAAFFSLNEYTITSSATGPGTIAPTPSVNVIYGNNEKFTMTPNTGAHVDSIHVDGIKVDSLASYTFVNVQANHTIAAFFSLNQFTITSSETGPGTISPTPSVNVSYGSNQTFTMTPNTGAHVDSIHVDGVKVDSLASYTFVNVQANHTIAAFFSLNEYTITSSETGPGTISPTPSVNVIYGNNEKFTMTPNTGAHVDSIHVDGVKVDSLASYTFVNVQANHTIAAFFSLNQFTITSSETGPGTISPTPSVNVSYGSNQTFTMTPNTGAHVDSIHVDGIKVDSLASYTFVNVQANHTIAAFFSLNQYTITSSATGPGTISPTPSVNVIYGNNEKFTMTPNTGAHVDSIHVDGVKVDSLASYTFINVQANHTIAAFFSLNEYTITSSATGPGTIAPTPSVNVIYGNNEKFTMTPNTGAHVDSIHVDGIKVDSLASYTFVNVQANHTIAAFFSLNQYTITSSESGPGTISPTPSVNVSYGSNQTFTMTPNTGAHVDSIHVDGVKVDSLASYTFVNVTGNHTIAAFFSLNEYTITSSETGPGTIAPTPSVNVSYGSNQTFTLTPNTGAHVDSIHVDGVKVDSLASYTFVERPGEPHHRCLLLSEPVHDHLE